MRFVEFVVTANATVPVKPLSEETVIVEVPERPILVPRIVGLAETVKSWTWYLTLVL